VCELRRVAGTQLDPQAVEAFVEAFPHPGDLPISADAAGEGSLQLA
jgi:HD-GYP domain-containing protein (c-di-GMP phosphodiesterase class II)